VFLPFTVKELKNVEVFYFGMLANDYFISTDIFRDVLLWWGNNSLRYVPGVICGPPCQCVIQIQRPGAPGWVLD
jgi:hypothetical protein